jgi:hypothetical protein
VAISGIKGSGIGSVAQPNEFFTRNQPAYASPYTSALEARRRQLAIENARQEEEFFAGKMGEQPSDVLYNDLYKDRIFNPNTPANRSLTQIIENPSASVLPSDPEKAPGFGLGSFTTPGGSKNTIDQQIRALSRGLASRFTSDMGGRGFNGKGDAAAEEAAAAVSSDDLGAMGPDGFEGAMENQQAQTDAAGTTGTTTTTKKTTTQEGELGAMGPDGAPGDMQAETLSPMEKLLSDTMKDFNKAAGKDTTGKTIDDYKQDFADATGVKIDGKPDKSHALMAFGLALMQNKAGKGFNVGQMLSSVGEAGEKAMPAFQKAKEQARAEKIAAGKYALGKVAEDKASEAATAKSKLEYIRELQKGVADAQEKERLELIKGVEARKLKRVETELKIFEEGMLPEDEREYEKSYDLTFAAGQGPASSWEIKMAYDKKKPDQAILINADPMIRKYIDGRAGIDDAMDLIDTMKDAAAAIAQGGGTAKFAYDRMNAVAKSLFPDLNTGNPTSEEQYTQALNMIMGRFKRFLTQETGNGISNRDVDIWERDIMKKPSWFQNLDATMNALDLLEDTFVQKREEFDAGIDHLYNPAYHRDQDAYNGLVDKYGTADQIKGTQGKLIFKDGKLVRG